VHCGVAVLGAILLLRHSDRLLLAPLYGGGLLLVAELGVRSIELQGVSLIDARSIGTRLGVVAAVAAVGVCGAASAALAVTGAPSRSLLLTAAGAIAAVGVCAAIALAAIVRSRSRYIASSDVGRRWSSPGRAAEPPSG
jgi:hypothetical protein